MNLIKKITLACFSLLLSQVALADGHTEASETFKPGPGQHGPATMSREEMLEKMHQEQEDDDINAERQDYIRNEMDENNEGL